MRIKKVTTNGTNDEEDILAIEEPLQIMLSFRQAHSRVQKDISITMRTPGHDEELAAGFFFTEGIIEQYHEIESVRITDINKVLVELKDDVQFDLHKLNRNFYTTSSCGVCGKSSIDALKTERKFASRAQMKFDLTKLMQLPAILETKQEVFRQTGGLHASALFNSTGELILLREDVGRHNALDKLIGHSMINGEIPLNEKLLLLSGRASFELMQKAYMAGITFVASVGAPSTLAAEFAIENDITLVGFLKENRFNIYNGERNIIS